jgi:predicted ATPase
VEAGLAQLQQGLADWRASGAELYVPYFLGLQAAAHTRAGRGREGLDLLIDALARADESNEGWFKAELHRLQGEALISQSVREQPEGENCFHRAMELARQQNAGSWELRAATSLARLWRDQGKRAEARDLLAPVYGWFTEGFDTPDLKEAKTLLDELCLSNGAVG